MGRRGSFCRNLLRWGACLLWTLGAGLAHEQQGLRLATEINHQQWIAGAHDALARIALSLLAPEQALSHAEAGLEAARELGSANWITYLIAEQVQAYTALGQPKLAEAALQEVRSGAENPRQDRSATSSWSGRNWPWCNSNPTSP